MTPSPRRRSVLTTALAVLAAAAAGIPSASAGTAAFRDCEMCPEMVELPSGTFTMGATPKEETDPFIAFNVPAELPRHEVTIAYRFAIGRFEVTVEEFSRFVEETGTETGGTCSIRLMEKGPLARKFEGTRHPDADQETTGPFLTYITDGSYAQPGLPVEARQPAVCISRDEAKAYLDWLSAKTGRSYRLPTEAEWEYAARAGTQTVAFWGDDLGKACDYANFGDRASGYQAGMAAPCAEAIQPDWTAPVGSYKPNGWGLHDMAGNVQEMVEDCWFPNHEGAPADGSPRSRDGCLLFVARGGDYELLHVSMRAAERLFFGYAPDADRVYTQQTASEVRSNVVGFRVAVSLSDDAWDR